MSIVVKCRIDFQTFPNIKKGQIAKNNFRIFKVSPIGNFDESLILDDNFQFSIKGDLSYLSEGDECELKIDLIEKNKWGGTYKVLECLTYSELENLTREESELILNKMASENNVKTLLDTYPDFIHLVLSNDWHDVIDTSKLYNIKESKMNSYARQLNEKFKYYSIMIKLDIWKFSMKDCEILCDKFKDIETIEKQLQNNPYYVLIDILGRRFTNNDCDKLICELREDLIDSDIRCEYLMLEVLLLNEIGDGTEYFKGGSTRCNASIMFDYCCDYAPILNNRMANVAKECDGIYYDETTKDMSRMCTYMKEVKISNFIKDLINNPIPLNLDWQKFKTIKDGTLTEEQSLALKEICENRIVIVDAGAGNGKSSSMFAMLQMFDEYKIKYRCMTATGKSAKRLEESSGRSCHTIHRDTLSGNIPEEVIILDEHSLLSVELLYMVICAIENDKVRLVLLGDIQQLINLSLGTPIKDIIESNKIPIVNLTKCFRFSDGGKAMVSTKCRNKEFYIEESDFDKERVTYGKNKDYIYVKFDGTIDQVINEYLDIMKRENCKYDKIWLVAPYNVGEFGCLALNNKIQAIVNPPIKNEKNIKITKKNKNNEIEIVFRKNDIVMNTVNNYNCMSLDTYEELLKDSTLSREDFPCEECMNGMSGKVLEVTNSVIKILFDEIILVFDKLEAKNLLLGYAINHFKVQGSQNDHILLLTISQHERLLNKQCLYTGLTRATKTVTEIGDLETMKNAVDRDDTNSRNTWLKDLLIDEN